MAIIAQKMKVLSKDFLTADTVCLTLERPEEFNYLAGQFAQIHVPAPETKIGKVPRSYSISSTPADKNLTFCIKLVEGGKAGEYLKTIKIGDILDIAGPLGKFIINIQTPLYFIATGVGIAPIIGLIRDELENKKNNQPMYLLFGMRSEDDLFWQNLFAELKNKYSNFDYKLTLSKPSEKWQGARGRVTDHLTKMSDKTAHYFICGNMQMITDVKTALEKHGINKENIHFEAL